MKKFLEEFKAFAVKGNVMDMAIGVVIGAAREDDLGGLFLDGEVGTLRRRVHDV